MLKTTLACDVARLTEQAADISHLIIYRSFELPRFELFFGQ